MTAQPQTPKSRYSDVSVTNKNCVWIFVSGSDKEHRHLLDIVWSVESLRKRGVSDSQIYIFQDYPDFKPHTEPFNLETRVFELKDFEAQVKQVGKNQFCFFVFTGHGSHEGIHTSGLKMPPVFFVELIKSIEGLERGFLVLGQCFSGIFDSLDARGTPELGIIGATKLHFSFSHASPVLNEKLFLVGKDGKPMPPWAANVFLLHFFNWIRNPADIDGDKKISLLDAYKYAGSRTNADMVNIKFAASLDVHGNLEAARTKIKDHFQKKSVLTEVDLDSTVRSAEQLSKILYLQQEPWLLHADLIRTTLMF